MSTINEENGGSRAGINTICNVVVLYDYNSDTKAGVPLPTEKITNITINEDIFGHLPTININLCDEGALFHAMGFAMGKQIYVKMTPGALDDETVAPYVEAIFILQQYRTYTSESKYIYELVGIYSALAYMSNIRRWPLSTDVSTSVSVEKQFTSIDAMRTVASAAGLKPAATEISTNDCMLWLNTNMVCGEFIKHLADHSWISEEDSLIYYIDIDGNFVITSLLTLTGGPSKHTYIDARKYDKMLADPGKTVPYYKAYDDIDLDNRGFLMNEGAYARRNYLYDPYTLTKLDATKFAPQIVTSCKASASSYMMYPNILTLPTDTDTASTEGLVKSKIPGTSNIPAGAGTYITNISSSMYFAQTHKFYDIAPLHNLSQKRAFFQVFVNMTLNTSYQVKEDLNKGQRTKLGDHITVNFLTNGYEHTVQNGDFIICSLSHVWVQGAAYTVVATGVRDTIPGTESRIITGTTVDKMG